MKTIRPYDKTEKKGRLWAALILIFNFLFSGLFLVVNLNPLIPLIQFGLSVALFCGYKGIRFVYAASALFNLCLTLYYLLGGVFSVDRWNLLAVLGLVLFVFYALFCTLSAILYYVSKAMDEYMYRRRTDY